MHGQQRFDCQEALRALDSYIDRELSESEFRAVQAHLDLCEGCARDFRFESSLVRQIKAKVRRIHVPDGLVERVTRLLAEE